MTIREQISASTVQNCVYELQLSQLEHDENCHKDILSLPLVERIKHMALHNAKYVGYLVDALDAKDQVRFQGVLTDALIIVLATANSLNQDLAEALVEANLSTETLGTLGLSFADQYGRNSNDPFEFVKRYARETGLLAKACESLDHMENIPLSELIRQSNLTMFKLILAEAALRRLDLETLCVTVHIPPARRRSSRAAIQAAAMAGIGGEGRLARAAAMSEQA